MAAWLRRLLFRLTDERSGARRGLSRPEPVQRQRPKLGAMIPQTASLVRAVAGSPHVRVRIIAIWFPAFLYDCSTKGNISLDIPIHQSADAGMRHQNRMAPWKPHSPCHGSQWGYWAVGGAAKIVEADETDLARSRKTKRPADLRHSTNNAILMSVVERGGDIRSTMLDDRTAMGVVRQGRPRRKPPDDRYHHAI